MQFLNEIRSLIKAIQNWLILVVLATLFFFSCGPASITVFGVTLPFPIFTEVSFSARVLSHMAEVIVPEGIPMLVTEPLAAFVAQVKISFLLACLVTAPAALFSLVSYLQPALYRRERLLLYAILIPTSLLFAAGNWFAYTFILPTTFSVLYGFAESLGAMPFISVGDFVGLSMALMLLSGISFTLPIGMFLLSLFGAIKPSIWVTEWRYAAVIFLVLSAIITPDGSGVTMMLFSVPLVVLYIAGAIASVHFTGKERRVEVLVKE